MALARFRLLAGQHIARDKKQPKDPETGLHPVHTYNQGDAVYDDVDLVAKFGATKFALEKGNPKPYVAPGFGGKAKTFPQGQVLEGKQVTFRMANGQMMTGVMVEDAEKPPRNELVDFDDDDEDNDSDRAAKPAQAATETTYSRDELETMTVPALKEVAADEGIDLGGATRKDDIVNVIVKKQKK